MKTQLLIFDLDGTLIDSRGDLTAGVNHMRRHYGLEDLSVEVVGGYVGNGVRKLVERSLQGAEVDVEEALKINLAYYCAHMTDLTYLYEGVQSGISALAEAGHKIALLTNKNGDPAREILQHFDLADHFCAMLGGGDIEHLKPHPEGIYSCMNTAGIGAEDTWMIGDHCTDLEVAENAGVKSAFVEYGFGEKRQFDADAYFASFSELVGYFV